MRQFPASATSAVPVAIGLPPEGFDKIFPFHFACDAELRVTQIGTSLRRMAADLTPGMPLQEVFGCKRPAGELSAERLARTDGSLVILLHRASGILMRGQFVSTSGVAGWVFIGSPWFVNAAAFEASGLSLEDIAPHDSVAELLLYSQTQQMAINDLNLLNERLERKRRQVEETEALYRAAISAADAVAYREEFRRDEFTYCGEGFQALTGFEAGQLRPSVLRALGDPGGADANAVGIERSSSDHGGRRRREFPFRTRDGELRWLSDASVVIRDAEGTPVGAIGALYDVTAQRNAGEQLRRSEEQAQRLAIVTSRTSSAVVITNAERQIEWVNDAFTRLSGYTIDEVRGRLMRDVLRGPETDPVMMERSLEAMAANRGFRGEMRLRRKDGSIFWVSAEVQPLVGPDGALSGYTAVGADITSAKEYEHRLERLGEELNAILSVIPGGIVALDDCGRFAYCNSAFETLMGRTGSELQGLDAGQLDRLLARLCDQRDRPEGFLTLADSASDVLRFVNPARTITRTARLIQGDSAASQWRAFYLRDVTRETELDRMKSEFLSTAAHELRTPMSSVHGFAELLISRDFDADTARSIARTIHRQSSFLVQMVNELLDLARIEAGRGRDFVMETQPLAPIVHETAMAILVSGDPRRVELVPAAGDSLHVNVDGSKLRLAVTNVIGNAYKYSRGQGAIRVSLPTRYRLDRQEVGVRVQDEGIGMTPDQLSQVFERFYRANAAGDLPGTGLGMTLVKEILESMWGSVEIASQPGRGTTVTLWLPVAAA